MAKTLDKDVTEILEEIKDSQTPLGEFTRLVTALDKAGAKQASYQLALYSLARQIDEDARDGRQHSVEYIKLLMEEYAPKAGLPAEKVQKMYQKIEEAYAR